MKKSLLLVAINWFIAVAHSQTPIQKFEFINFSQVTVTDNFWKPRIDKVATKTLPACIYQTETVTSRIRNFQKVARKNGEKHEGIYFDDSDVYKALEAMAYSLKTHPDTAMERKADDWIDIIAAAQLPDGYLNTYFTLTDLNKRWTDMEKHEDYCAGHLIEAAVAYYNTTGKRKLLDVAIRFADHIDSTFRLQNRNWVSGHEEIELALVKLFRTTKNERYLKLANWYLEQRGHGYGRGAIWQNKNWGPAYCQDGLPVREQKEITGHAVRAMYLYTGTADVAAATGDTGYMNAMQEVWKDVVYRNMYITGGIGSSGDNEGFSLDYDLPNAQAYCETCASVGMVLWNQRMCELTGDSRYLDVLERSLYNGALDGLSLSGDRFFYDNVLSSNGQHQRREWFGTACCPSNIARLVTSIGDYIYGKSENAVWINLFVASSTRINTGNSTVDVKMSTDYPWNGQVKLNIDPVKKSKFQLFIRIPGWASGEAVPGDLYRFVETDRPAISFAVNGKAVSFKEERGYAIIEREWKKGDVVNFEFQMDVQKIIANNDVKTDRQRTALQRGPILYCVEGADNKEGVWNILLPADASFTTIPYKIIDEPVVALKAELPSLIVNEEGTEVKIGRRNVTAIPYYTWANRGAYAMQVWIPARINEIKINDAD